MEGLSLQCKTCKDGIFRRRAADEFYELAQAVGINVCLVGNMRKITNLQIHFLFLGTHSFPISASNYVTVLNLKENRAVLKPSPFFAMALLFCDLYP